MSEHDERMPRPASPAEAPTVAGASDDVTVADSAALPGENGTTSVTVRSG